MPQALLSCHRGSSFVGLFVPSPSHLLPLQAPAGIARPETPCAALTSLRLTGPQRPRCAPPCSHQAGSTQRESLPSWTKIPGLHQASGLPSPTANAVIQTSTSHPPAGTTGARGPPTAPLARCAPERSPAWPCVAGGALLPRAGSA